MAEDVKIVAGISVDTTNASASVNKLKKDIADTGKEAEKAGGANFSKLKETLTGVSPAAKAAAEGTGMLNNALNVLKANPIIAVVSALIAIVVVLFEKFKQMENVSDALGKAFGVFSGIINAFVNKVLTPLIDGFVKVIDLFSKGAEFITSIFSPSLAEAGKRSGELAEALDDLNDVEAKSAITRAESNRKLQEAREIAQDANVPIKQRIAALKEAGRIEKEEMTNAMTIAQTRAKFMLEQIAIELGARQDLVKAIRNGSIEQLKAARDEIMAMKNVDKEKLKSIDALIIQAEEQGAQLAKVQKKTNSAIASLEKEEENKRKEARQKQIEEAKKLAEEKERIAKEHQDRLRKIEEEGEKAIQAAINDLRKANRESELKANEQEYQKRVEAAEKAGLSIFRITEAYQFKRNEINDKYNKEDADAAAKAESEKNTKLIEQQTAYLAAHGSALYKQIEAEKAATEAKKQLAEAEYQARITALEGYANAASTVSTIIGQQTAVGKGLAVAASLIETYTAIVKTLKAFAGVPIPGYAIAQSIATGLAGLASVKKILSVQVPGASGGVSATLPSITAAAPVTPQQASTSLNAASIQAVGNAAQGGVARAFVLDADINNNADRAARLNRAARLG